MLAQMQRSSLCSEPIISHSKVPIFTTSIQTTEFDTSGNLQLATPSAHRNSKRRLPYGAASRHASDYGLLPSHDGASRLPPHPTSSSPGIIKRASPSCSDKLDISCPQFTASRLSFPESRPSCYKRPSPSSPKILKPPGEVGRPGRGGYNLRKVLGWSKQDYDNVKDFIKTLVARLDCNVPFTQLSLVDIIHIRDQASSFLFRIYLRSYF
ncbi:MAG: hypothetical protein NXY57DRAFT_967929 [Lentinula lateritia]|nr:MAG: hypothetical protein NXY57DRAFT_967929 [Lentinula lateritia]